MEAYDIYPDVIAVREGRATEYNIRRLAANIGDVVVLRRVLGYDGDEMVNFYPDSVQTTPGTMDTISSFLASYSKGKGSEPVSAAVAAVAEMEASGEGNERRSVGELIKSGDYEAAYKRIMEQSLKNPEKSIYFADQLRFLRKLMALRN